MSDRRDLHICPLLCGRVPDKIHFSDSQHVKIVDYQPAADLAVSHLDTLPKNRLVSGLSSAADLDSVLNEGSAPAELALSFLAAPLAVARGGAFGNGRHRAQPLSTPEFADLFRSFALLDVKFRSLLVLAPNDVKKRLQVLPGGHFSDLIPHCDRFEIQRALALALFVVNDHLDAIERRAV